MGRACARSHRGGRTRLQSGRCTIQPRRSPSASAAVLADAGPGVSGDASHELRQRHDPHGSGSIAARGRVVPVARHAPLLRSHHLPPCRSRVRDPGRRPDRHRQRRARLRDGRHAPCRRELPVRRRRDGEDGGRAARHGRKPVLIVTAADAGLPPDYAIIGRVVGGQAVVRRIGRLGDADERPTTTIEITRATIG